ncbi:MULTISPECIES: transcriptional repressor LexA [Clostridium]|uniref:LexA repressor n=4 Tax=Clostridium TaxID=1485 RepID=D8GJK2_CLOLD|nr:MULTISPECIES: transcriptional repressor LexA [Clostridium]ADK15163.1 LexA repressor [Clostridium ljungdahlii DSM 13528]AGY74421.1 transcriptional repressor LexA [Clostridium autoethanogenum DSM 10061]ALU34609.1 SOS-response transcriptional repressor lexA [Clostridium autoethanogenum DSM 10061]OAA88642.1 LexA repressor [Clostridium ljungdahlii DSM 13528]OAA95013.1 LexA repressor [Clostridium coskatii]
MTEHNRDRQFQIYEFIKTQIREKGYPPSVREICAGVGLKSTSTVHSHLEKLEKKGFIKRDSSKSRTIEIINRSVPKTTKKELIDIPIVGTITAGMPILAVENIEDVFPLPIEYVKNKNQLFILKVQGESMIDAGILDGDMSIIEQTNFAENGDIVAALIDNEATLKRFFKEKDHIRLQPENESMSPIIVDDCKIIGKLVGIYRRY